MLKVDIKSFRDRDSNLLAIEIKNYRIIISQTVSNDVI